MCGIAGSIALTTGIASADRVNDACTAMARRGPDDSGVAVGRWTRVIRPVEANHSGGLEGASTGDSIALGHRRLAIIELGPAGHQPMVSADGRVALVFNGEIYNYIELRASLAHQFDFQTQTDTEVLLAGVRQRGPDFLAEVIGMFAFAYVDAVRGEVLLGRDHFGIKPLFYVVEGGVVHFASELKGLRSLARAPWDVSPRATFQFLRFGVTDDTDGTFFEQVKSVPAAHSISFERGSTTGTTRRYWRLRRDAIVVKEAMAPALIAAEVATSVALHLRSDVPIGACLSGGLDSTALVALMRRQLGRGADIHAFSFISPIPEESEAPFVNAAVRAFNLTAHTTNGPPTGLERAVADVVRSQDAPFGSLSIVAQYCVFEAAHCAGVKVLLDGQGADELFGGYVPAVSARMAELLRQGRLNEIGRLLRTFEFSAQRGGRARMILGALMRVLPPSLVKIALAAAGEPLVPNWLDAKWLGATLDGSTALVYRGHPDMRDELIAFVEERTLPALLRYEDRNSMRWSVESRVPFCTPRLAELAMSLPSRAFVDGSGRTKAVVRDAFREMLPEAIVNRPKIGFLAPDRRWMGELDQWISGAIADGEQRLSEIISWQKLARRRLRQPALSHQSNSTTWRLASYCAWAREWNIQNARTATQAP